MLNKSNNIYFEQLSEPQIEYEIHVLMEDGEDAADAEDAEWLITGTHLERLEDVVRLTTHPDYRHRDRRRRIVAVRRESTVIDWFDPNVVRELPEL